MSRLAHSSDDATMDAIETQARKLEEQETRQAASPTGLELVISKAVNPLEVFTTGGLDPILDRIEAETRSIVLDISTKKGREQIASLAHKVAKSKTALDNAGKELVAGWKEQAKKVDVERARAWDRLEALQREVRQPLTDWENAEKQRVANHESNLSEIANAGPFTLQNWQTLTVEAMQDRLAEIRKDAARDWQEFTPRAKQAIEAAESAITSAIIRRQAHDAEKAELARLRKEEEERKQRAHEEHIARTAAEQARLAAEEEAQKAAEAEARRVAAEKGKAEQERQRIEREKEAAEARALKAEQDRIAAEQKAAKEKELAEQRAAQAERDRSAAEAKAKEDAHIAAEKAAKDRKAAEEAAAHRERQRIEAEKKAEADAAAKREADKAHKAKIINEALEGIERTIALAVPDLSFAHVEVIAKAVVEAIALGHVPYISIRY